MEAVRLTTVRCSLVLFFRTDEQAVRLKEAERLSIGLFSIASLTAVALRLTGVGSFPVGGFPNTGEEAVRLITG